MLFRSVELFELLAPLKRAGARIYGIGAPSRASTLINYTGLDDGILDCVLEISTSHKLNKYIPGTRIPVLHEEKLFEDVKAEKGEKALVTFHTVAFECSIGLVNLLQATRLLRKGFETSVLLYGPGVTLGVQRGFPKLGDEAFPGHQNFNNTLVKFMAEGGKVYACRFALQALYGHGEPSLIPGIIPISPLDVLDLTLLHRNENAFMLHTWTL